MCGIAGVVTTGRPIADRRDVARRLADALAHRGPDGEGVWTSEAGSVLLVHRRLAIIDLGPGRRAADGHARRPAPSRVQRRGVQLPGRFEWNWRRAANGSRRPATPKCSCGCWRSTARRRWRACAACSRSGGGTRPSTRSCSRAIASGSSRCMSRRQAINCRSRPSSPRFAPPGSSTARRRRPASSGFCRGAASSRR